MPGLFDRGKVPEGYETKVGDISGSSSKVLLTAIAAEKVYPPEEKPSAFEMSAELRSSVMELPMCPDGSTMKDRVACLEEAADRQQYRNNVNDSTLDALGEDQVKSKAKMNELLAQIEAELNQKLEDQQRDLDLRFSDQADENDRTNRKMSALKQEGNQLRRKFAYLIARLSKIEDETDVVPPEEDIVEEVKPISLAPPRK